MSVDTNPNHKGGCVFKDERMDAICLGESCDWTRRKALFEQGFEMVPDGPVLIVDNLRRRGTAPLGYMVVRDENGLVVADWDAAIHTERRDGELEVLTAKRREPLYEWYLAEVRRAEAGD